MKKTIIATAVLFGLMAAMILPVAAGAAPVFSDVQGHWAEKDIRAGFERGYVSGYPDGTFRPNGTITRAEAASMLARITKLAPTENSDAFADLDNHWAKDPVRKLAALGFIDPADYSAGFEPNKAVTRYEVMKWIASGLAKSNPDFAQALIDTKETLLPTPESFKGGISPEQVPYIALVKGTGIIEGFEDGTMRPANTTTRAEVISILLRYEKVEGTDPKQYRALNELREVGLTGTNMTSVTNFKYMFYNDKYTDFPGIQGKHVTGRKGLATIQVHKMIFTPLEGSVYFDLLVYPVAKELMESSKGNTIYVFQEVSFTSHVDKLDAERYLHEFPGGSLLATGGFSVDFAKKKGFNTDVKVYPKAAIDVDFIRKDETVKAWFSTAVSKNSHRTLTTDSGMKMAISDSE